jgi:hypothetical protein
MGHSSTARADSRSKGLIPTVQWAINAYLLALAARFAFGGEQLSQSGFRPI